MNIYEYGLIIYLAGAAISTICLGIMEDDDQLLAIPFWPILLLWFVGYGVRRIADKFRK